MRHVIRRVFRLKSERGAALVEFALVVPFLMLIMCATIDFGLAVYTLNNLTAAVREGGRFAATRIPAPAANDTAVQNRVYNYISNMNNNGLTAAQVRAKITSTAMDANGNITVSITAYPYKPFTPLAPLLNLGVINLNRTAIFRSEMAPG
jgi:Flp pilus assembly protein TadG